VLVFPLLCAAGGTMLLTHSHAIANVKDRLLIELTHTPLALAGIAAGWGRWLEIRLNPRETPVAWQIAGWVWPACILFCGLLLLGYREAGRRRFPAGQIPHWVHKFNAGNADYRR
jgi:copper resistance protein D